jgi:hypothetical protein
MSSISGADISSTTPGRIAFAQLSPVPRKLLKLVAKLSIGLETRFDTSAFVEEVPSDVNSTKVEVSLLSVAALSTVLE